MFGLHSRPARHLSCDRYFPTLLAATGLTAVALPLIGLLSVALIIGAIWAPNTQGKTLKEIETERYGAPISPDLPEDTAGATDRNGHSSADIPATYAPVTHKCGN